MAVSISAYVVSAVSGNLIRDQLETSTGTLHTIIDAMLKANVQTYLRSKVEVGADAFSAALRRSANTPVSAGRAVDAVIDELLSYQVGRTGYFYALDLTGNVIFHPDSTIVGTNQSGKEPVDEQLAMRNGYLEYMWKNTYESLPRRKALYMHYMPGPGWILTATSYRAEFTDMIDREALRTAVNSVSFGKSGYSYILDRGGAIIAHPYLRGGFVHEHFSPGEHQILMSSFFSGDAGYTTYLWKEPGSETPRTKIVYHKYLPDFDWVVSTAIYKDEINRPLTLISVLNAIVALAASGILFLFILRITRSIEGPVFHIIDVLRRASAGDLTLRAENTGLKELDELVNHLNYFIATLQEKISALGQLTAGIAHELNSPLGAIRSASKTLEANLNTSLREQGRLLSEMTPDELADFFGLLEQAPPRQPRLESLLDRDVKKNLIKFLESRSLEGREDIADGIIALGYQDSPEHLMEFFKSDRRTEHLLAASRIRENFFCLRIIGDAGHKAEKVVENLRWYLTAGEQNPRETLSLPVEIDRVLDLFHGEIRNELRIKKDYDPDTFVHGDRKRLSVLWNNLIKNALDAMEYRGELGIRVKASGRERIVEISDTGPGIDPGIRGRIFDPFFTTKADGAGMGLGLVIARRIVEDHGGMIGFSGGPGGTVFRISLPERNGAAP
jgi:signal transduction histidine kinase